MKKKTINLLLFHPYLYQTSKEKKKIRCFATFKLKFRKGLGLSFNFERCRN